jgi:hypothetical protein
LAILSSPFGYSVYAIWLFCLGHLSILSGSFGYSVEDIWLFCLGHLAILSRPFGYFFWVIRSEERRPNDLDRIAK